jgi:brefeldin A-inhibited guanine nucleotide-exchange protein
VDSSSSSSNTTHSVASSVASVLAVTIADGIAAARSIGPVVKMEALDFEHTIVKCVTHIEVLQAVRDVFLTPLIKQKPKSRKGSSSSSSAQAVTPLSTVTPADPSTRSEGSINTVGPSSLTVPETHPVRADEVHIAVELIPPEHRIRLLKCIYSSYSVARAFNADHDLRHAIWRRGFVQQMPNLVKQETISLAAHIRMLFAVYRAIGDPEEARVSGGFGGIGGGAEVEEEAKMVLEMLTKEVMDVMERFVVYLGDQHQQNQQQQQQQSQQHSRDVALWSPVIVIILKEFLAMEGWWIKNRGSPTALSSPVVSVAGAIKKCAGLKKHLPRFFRLSIRFMSVDRVDVRQALQEFMEKVGDEIFGSLSLE